MATGGGGGRHVDGHPPRGGGGSRGGCGSRGGGGSRGGSCVDGGARGHVDLSVVEHQLLPPPSPPGPAW